VPNIDVLPSKAETFFHWKDRLVDMGIFIDWGEPSCWTCGFHYGSKYDIKSSDASWSKILNGWERIPLQRCHIVPRSLGGMDESSNLFLMCRECHDLQPNTALPEIFLEWACTQNWMRRETAKIEEALRSFAIVSEERKELLELIDSSEFSGWTPGNLGCIGLNRTMLRLRAG
jgi:5-methylcytosine-specific restriction endonuclease McrA